jgi:predicted hydrolase (HD superfamily)
VLTDALGICAKKLRAIVLDCEMAGTGRGINEVVMLCAVDYSTGASIINALVRPDGRTPICEPTFMASKRKI